MVVVAAVRVRIKRVAQKANLGLESSVFICLL